MDRDGVKQFRPDFSLERRGAFLDHPQAEVDVTEQPALLGTAERGPALELERPAQVVEQRSRKHQIGAQTRMQLRGLAAQGRYPDGVLE